MSDVQECIQLGDIADITMGQSPDSSSVSSEEQGLPFLQGCAEFGEQTPRAKFYCMPPLRVAKAESILISVRAPVGTMNWGDQSYCIGRGLAAIKAKPGVADTKFLGYSVAQNVSFLHRRSQGSTFLAIGSNDLNIFTVPAYSPEKQQKIATILSNTDQAIEKTEALIEKYQQIKAGLMHDLFTRGIGADGKLRPPREQAPELYQQTPIGWIPKGWEVKSLKDLYKNPIRDFGSFSSTNLITFLDEGVPFIKSEMIKEEEVDWSTVSFISTAVHGLLSKSHVQEGQILFSKIGSALGKAVLYGGERGVCNSNAAVAKIETDGGIVSPQFIEMFLNSEFARKQFRLMIISLLPRINLGDINKLLVQTPKIDEQHQICACYNRLKAKLMAERNLLTKLKKQKSGLMHDLLTGKVRVKLDSITSEMAGG